MKIALLQNDDGGTLEDDPGSVARKDIEKVAAALDQAFRARGHQSRIIPAGSDLRFIEALRGDRPELVVNLCESIAGDARGEMLIPPLLDVLGLRYTGSAAPALALALHKDVAKHVLRGHGVSTPASALLTKLDELASVRLEFPLIVKPAREDASSGIDFDSVVRDRTALAFAVERVHQTFHQPALVEQYIAGQEVYVPLLGNNPRRNLPMTEILYGEFYADRPQIVSYKAKWDPESPDWKSMGVGRAKLSAETEARCLATAFAAFEALGCRDYGRVDLRVTPDGQPYVLEVNPNCDLHPEAGFANAARMSGMEYADLAEAIARVALERAP